MGAYKSSVGQDPCAGEFDSLYHKGMVAGRGMVSGSKWGRGLGVVEEKVEDQVLRLLGMMDEEKKRLAIRIMIDLTK